jgi:leader peptidase (prepilin peptidase)/N-methyltransferase
VSPLFVLLAATFGAASAAFLPRLADRLAVTFGAPSRSGCAVCLRPFEAGFAGWVRVGASCSCPLNGYAGSIVPAGAVVAALLAVAVGPRPLLPFYLLGAVLGLLLATIDVRCLRLPDPLVGALTLVLGGPSAILRPEGIPRALLAGVVLLAAYLIIGLRGGLGLGDVKLAAGLGLVLGFAGWPAVIAGVVVAHLISGSVALFLLVTRRVGRARPLPFGPALLVGALIGLTAFTAA